MGAGSRRDRPTIQESFSAEARSQARTRPATRPRPPPIADNKHTAPLWSQHLRTYVSYSYRERIWKRWSTTAKLWKLIPNIDGVISGESKLQNQALKEKGLAEMPPKPEELGWSDPLWYQSEYLFVSYNSSSGEWMERTYNSWVPAQLEKGWPRMPVSTISIDKEDQESEETTVGSSSSVTEPLSSASGSSLAANDSTTLAAPVFKQPAVLGSKVVAADVPASKKPGLRLLRLLERTNTKVQARVE